MCTRKSTRRYNNHQSKKERKKSQNIAKKKKKLKMGKRNENLHHCLPLPPKIQEACTLKYVVNILHGRKNRIIPIANLEFVFFFFRLFEAKEF